MLVLFGTPTAIGVLVGLVYSIRLRGELDEARTLAAVMCRELDDAGYELQRMRETLDRAADEPPTVELPALRSVPRDTSGRHRLGDSGSHTTERARWRVDGVPTGDERYYGSYECRTWL